MEKNIKNLAALDDKALKDLVTEITAALGADPRASAALTANPQKLRGMLENLSDKEAEKLINKAGRDKAQLIYEAIRKRQ